MLSMSPSPRFGSRMRSDDGRIGKLRTVLACKKIDPSRSRLEQTLGERKFDDADLAQLLLNNLPRLVDRAIGARGALHVAPGDAYDAVRFVALPAQQLELVHDHYRPPRLDGSYCRGQARDAAAHDQDVNLSRKRDRGRTCG